MIEIAERHRLELLSEADAVTSDWRVYLILDDITDEERTKLVAWMDSKEELKSVDTSTAPDIDWPVPP